MFLCPLSTPLFPYTTLFRSPELLGDRVEHRLHLRRQAGEDEDVLEREAGRAAERVLDRPAAGGQADRKSTRLNSSHVEISYAVFCLKKKRAFSSQLATRLSN